LQDAPITGRRAAVAGLLLAAAAIQREVGLFALPVVVVYLVWARVGWRPLIAFVLVAALPLGGYAALIDAKTGVFGLTATSGWTIYGRVAGFADCGGAAIAPDARGLCETPAQRASHPRAPDWYIWAAGSPAIRLFHRGQQTRAQRARSNAILGSFARRIIVAAPGAFAAAIAGDFVRYFTPGATPYADAVSATSLPRAASDETVDQGIRRRVVPGAHATVQAPASIVRAYRAVVHVPRPVLAALAFATLIGLALRVYLRRELLLFGGTALVLLLGTSATGGFGLRYLLPAVPLLAIGGVLAGRDLAAALRTPAPLRVRAAGRVGRL
ncbi:MAG: hypothetical protein ACRDL5_15190, partial [Solirubrobacteraceae bacterium]